VKLCAWYNFLQSFVVFHLAPWAWVRLKYSLHRDGRVEIDFSGSGIPSQYHYVDWQLNSVHHMDRIGEIDVNGFLTAGNCNSAPWVANFTCP
jgi:hypothetical protein